MNIFRLAGDMTHLASVIVLLLKIHTIKSCAGVSLKTQELYALVFATRYLDIFTDYISFYNTVMKLIFLGSSFSIVWYIRHHKIVRRSYDKDQDTFRHLFLVLPCLLLALVINEKFTFKEVMWAFFLIFGSCCHTSSADLVAKDKKYRQLDWPIRSSPWDIPVWVQGSTFHVDQPCQLHDVTTSTSSSMIGWLEQATWSCTRSGKCPQQEQWSWAPGLIPLCGETPCSSPCKKYALATWRDSFISKPSLLLCLSPSETTFTSPLPPLGYLGAVILGDKFKYHPFSCLLKLAGGIKDLAFLNQALHGQSWWMGCMYTSVDGNYGGLRRVHLFGGGNAFHWENIPGFCGAAENEVFSVEDAAAWKRSENGTSSYQKEKKGLSLLEVKLLDIRACSDIALCGFLLLLLPKLEEQCEARATGLSCICLQHEKNYQKFNSSVFCLITSAWHFRAVLAPSCG
ncbi:endoplasmic reticulum retention defective 2B [Actinidia rufa]|uniref:Endoplasmic reticulum retention defective 2B n=1 Tax=Actinidia rufa TaxID=165716 RepID=A0A7J0GIH1_9ERIC|nr:endoplasmic reticulum retention defective 2B [Actinidia rufa]